MVFQRNQLLVLTVTYPRFKFTHLPYTLIWLHSAILLVGAHFTYWWELARWTSGRFGQWPWRRQQDELYGRRNHSAPR
jgi:uncharacterized membrane protein YjdF